MAEKPSNELTEAQEKNQVASAAAPSKKKASKKKASKKKASKKKASKKKASKKKAARKAGQPPIQRALSAIRDLREAVVDMARDDAQRHQAIAEIRQSAEAQAEQMHGFLQKLCRG